MPRKQRPEGTGACAKFEYHIYKLNFEYDLSDDLYGDFRFVYEGLCNVMLSYGDDVQVHVTQKSYKLIETTKQMIADREALDSIIQLSIIIVKLIDKRVWNKDVKIYNQMIHLFPTMNWYPGVKSERNRPIYCLQIIPCWSICLSGRMIMRYLPQNA